MRRVSSFMRVTFESGERVADGHLAALELREHVADRGRRVVGRVDFRERKLAADPVKTVLDRGVADAEELLHLLDGAVAADEGRDEDLVLGGELGEGRELELTVDRDAGVRQ